MIGHDCNGEDRSVVTKVQGHVETPKCEVIIHDHKRFVATSFGDPLDRPEVHARSHVGRQLTSRACVGLVQCCGMGMEDFVLRSTE